MIFLYFERNYCPKAPTFAPQSYKKMDKSKLIAELLPVAYRAGAAILKVYADEKNFQVSEKSDLSPLTQADLASNTVINDGLRNLSQLFPIVSEENREIPYETRKHYTYYWLVDPLDGTKEFIKRNGEFTVNIALIHHHTPVLGVVYAPCLDEMYWAVRGEGAFVVKEGVTTRLQAPAFQAADKGLRIVASRSHLNADTEAYIARFDEPALVSKGSSLKFLLMADGQAHIYPRIAPTMEWDTAAAQIVLEEAGGKVLRFDDHQPLTYNKENLLNPYFVAFGKMTPA